MKQIDISEEFHLFRVNNGVALIRPEEHKYHPVDCDLNHTVKSISQLECNIFFYDSNNSFRLANDSCADACGFSSPKAALNKTLFDTGKPESAKVIYENNNEVMKKSTRKIIEEEFVLKKEDDFPKRGLSIKLPWYNNQFEILGLFGITIIFGEQKIDSILSHISEIGLLHQEKNICANNLKKFYFSRREKEIIYHMTTKKTSREIGNQLCISTRTIEKHIENIKNKLNVKSKAEIINMMMDQ